MKLTSKMLGDAGEHYALSQFTFGGFPATKMPDNWEGYDLAVETGEGLIRVSVKTRTETESWAKNAWFIFDDRRECDWMVFLFRPTVGPIQAWVMPFDVALQHANTPGPARKDPHNRDIRWEKLQKEPLSFYSSNWSLNAD